MSKAAGLAVTLLLGAGGLAVSSWTHASSARRAASIAEGVGSGNGLLAGDSLNFEVLGFKFNRLWIPFWPCSPRTVYGSSWSSRTFSKDATREDIDAFNRAWVCHDPLPSGFVAAGPERREQARTTGAVDWFGRHEIQVRVTAAASELASAKLYLDDDLVGEASLDDGKIVQRGDEAEATLEFFLPWIPQFTLTLITDDLDGRIEESTYSIGRSATSPK
jgi:hypothetical protein